MSSQAEWIVVRVVLLVCVPETKEVLGPGSWIFPFQDKVDQSNTGAQALFRELCNHATCGPFNS